MGGVSRRRKLGFQPLEKRHLLAAHISEILVDPLFGDNNTTQMVELRGEPNQTLADGTYLVVISERVPDEGKIHGIFDLGGQQFGSNGYLVLLQQDSPHQPHPDANVLQSTTEAFGGLPGGIYTDTHTLSNRIDFIIGANGYFLIESNVPPTLGADIDADNNGLIDSTVADQWTVLDSISLHPFVGRGKIAYGEIVFAEIGAVAAEIDVPDGVEVIHTEGFGYAGRVGESEGHRPQDWVMGTTQDENRGKPNQSPRWALVDNLFGTPSQYPFSGRDLDHVGEANFVGGVRGRVEATSPEIPVNDVTVFADTNGNGIRDSLTFAVDPDDVIDYENPLDEDGKEKNYPLINAYPGVTITNFALDAFPASSVTAEKERDFPGTLSNRIFAKGGIDWFPPGGVLRFDFYRPVNYVSIVAIGSDNPLSKVYGRIDAYNAAGELIDSERSGVLIDSGRQTISVTSVQDDIAYVFAFADDDHLDGGPFGRFDRMIYSQLEPAATTDADGYYQIEHLFPGRYDVTVLGNHIFGAPRTIEVEKYENFVQNYSLSPNRDPVTGNVQLSILENSATGAVAGSLAASDPDAQPLMFRLAESGDHGFVIDEATGEITLGADAGLDFESRAQYTFDVVVSDPLGASVEATVTIDVTDVNEAPTIESKTFTVSEATESGTVIGSVEASDPDVGMNQTLTYEIIGGNGATVFRIDSTSGAISLDDENALDFETARELSLEVRVRDGGTPDLSATATMQIQVGNVNEPPVVVASTFVVSEAAEPGDDIGAITASDPDGDQTLQYGIIGGSGAEKFSINPETGVLTVRENADLDFETDREFTLLVSVSDNGSPVMTTTVEQTVQIGDVNEQPVIQASMLAVSESAATDDEVGSVVATDPDADQTLTFEIVGGTGASVLQIDSVSGLVTVKESNTLDHESDPELTLEVRVTDDGDPATSATRLLAVQVIDANEVPAVITDQITLDENSEGELGRIEIEDPDREQTHAFELIGGSGQHLVTLSPEGILSLASEQLLDFESGDTYELEVQVTDDGEQPVPVVHSITLSIRDVDEPPAFVGEFGPLTATSGQQFRFEISPDSIVDPEGHPVTVEASAATGTLPNWLTFDAESIVFSGIPSSEFAGSTNVTVRAFNVETPEFASVMTFQLVVELSETPLHNQFKPHDVNGDNRVTANDALRIINFLARSDSGNAIDLTVRLPSFFDVTGDNFVTALDALRVINEMSRIDLGGASSEFDGVVADVDDRRKTHDAALAEYLRGSLF